MITVHLDPANLKPVGQTTGPGVINMSSSFGNPVFIQCFSAPADGRQSDLPIHLGQRAVRIEDPKRLAQMICDHLQSIGELDFPLECVRVRYMKGEELPSKPMGDDRNVLAYGYKPPQFAHEYEYRFVLITSPASKIPSIVDDYWKIELGKPIPGGSLIRLEGEDGPD